MSIIVVNDVDNFLWCKSCAFRSVEDYMCIKEKVLSLVRHCTLVNDHED